MDVDNRLMITVAQGQAGWKGWLSLDETRENGQAQRAVERGPI